MPVTTASTESTDVDTEAALEERYRHQIELLVNRVRLSRLGGIATVECDNIDLRKQLFRYFARRLARENVYLYPIRLNGSELNLVRLLRDITDRTGFKDLELVSKYENIVLFIYGLERYSDVQQEQFLQFLNLFRDATTIIKQPIVIWATSDFVRKMAIEAPDFWSWKGMLFRFDADRDLDDLDDFDVLTRYLYSLVHDPDYAIWQDLYVPLRGSQLHPLYAGSLEYVCRAAETQWHEAFLPGYGWSEDEPAWARGRSAPLLQLTASCDRVAVLGAPGAGKTTALRYLTYRTAEESRRQIEAGPDDDDRITVPVFVKLSMVRRQQRLEDLIVETLRLHGMDHGDTEILHDLVTGARDTIDETSPPIRLLLLFDGMNEISLGQQKTLRRFLKDVASHHRVVVSCRIENYVKLDGFSPLLIEPLREDDIEEYLVRYLGVQRGERLTAEILEDHQLRELAHSPLMLFMFTQIAFHQSGSELALPRVRGLLFEAFTERLLRRTETEWWRIFGRTRAKVKVDISRDVLGQLAFVMQEEGLTTISRERCYWLIREGTFANPVPASATDIFEGLLFSGLIRLTGNRESIEFIHQAVREYFAAVQLQKTEAPATVYLERDDASNWAGTIAVYFSLSASKAEVFRDIVGDGTEYDRLWIGAEALACVLIEGDDWQHLRDAFADDSAWLARFEFCCGLVLERRGNYKEALRRLREAVTLAPEFPFAPYELGVVYRQLGEYDYAIIALRNALQLAPEVPDVYNQLGIAYFEAGDYTRAQLVFQAAVELEPNNPHHHYNLGMVYSRLGAYARAQREFKQALTLKERYDAAREQLALLEQAAETYLLSHINRVPIFRELSLEHRLLLAQHFERRAFKAGDAVVVQGDAGDEFFIILSGIAELVSTESDDGEVVLNRLGAGDHFGEFALLQGTPRTATVRTITDMSVLALKRERFEEIRDTVPDLADGLVQTRNQRLWADVRRALEDRAAAPNGENRVFHTAEEGEQTVTVLAADIRNSTAMTRRLGPQKMLKFLKEFYREMVHVVHEEGTIHQYVGDHILALFESPDAAVQAAHEMQSRFRALVDAWTDDEDDVLEIGLGIGICTGSVVLADTDFDALLAGPTVMLATRLSARDRDAPAIYVDRATATHLQQTRRNELDIVRLERPLLLQGFVAPVDVYRLKPASPASTSLERSP